MLTRCIVNSDSPQMITSVDGGRYRFVNGVSSGLGTGEAGPSPTAKSTRPLGADKVISSVSSLTQLKPQKRLTKSPIQTCIIRNYFKVGKQLERLFGARFNPSCRMIDHNVPAKCSEVAAAILVGSSACRPTNVFNNGFEPRSRYSKDLSIFC